MKSIIGIILLTFAIGANAQSNDKTADDTHPKLRHDAAMMRKTLLSFMELSCTMQQNQGEKRMNATDECSISSMANSSACLDMPVCEPIDSQIKKYIESVKPSSASK
ncbi:hypothetical protein ACK32R_03945 [Aeromonas dhakensis]|uniref:hypothetical protein n=1 Tax=Aeromonas dhakensis TaxID=196024 RepID=UPI0039858C38